ncbi:beta-1,3-galactosyltransferase 5-like [Oculina patagonica]
MFTIRRRRRFLWLALCITVIAPLIYFVKNILNDFTPENIQTDLRKPHSNYEIILPITEPSGYLEQPLFLFVIISSSPNKQENAERRAMIRQTWGNFKRTHIRGDQPWKIVFMMGKASSSEMNKSIMAEHEKYGDLLIGDYTDGYRNITTKLLMAFQWASKIRCNYILKTDDDVYIDIPKLIEWLNVNGDPSSFYGGVLYSGIVVRDETHRHFVAEDELPLNRYPMFCKGAMFVVSWSLVPKMVELSRKVTRIPPDDAYVGILANQLGIYPVRIDGFFQAGWLQWVFNFVSICQLRDVLGIGDSLTPDEVNYVHQLKTSLSNRESFYTVCISIHMKFLLLLLFVCTCLLVCCYRICCRRKHS